MATNLDIDPRRLERAVEVSGERTKTAAVTCARRSTSLATNSGASSNLRGPRLESGYDYKAERTR